MDPAKPSLGMLRALTDEHVLRALMEHRRLTRAELAARTGISKPTISESVRRLCAIGLVADTGERTTGRGRIGSYFALADDAGGALVVSVAPEGVVAETLDAHGEVTGRVTERVDRPARPAQIAQALDAAARRVRRGPVRLAVVSAADPVDRRTGRLVHLPDAPFLVGDLSPVERLAEWVDGPVVVDNDVNWAARAEQAASGLDDFVYVHLGEGLGAAVVNDGKVRRGHSGFVGEIAHVLTLGPQRRAMPFTEVFAALGLRHVGTTAIDVDALPAAGEARATVARAVCGVLAAAVAFADPALVVVGGAWGPAFVEAIATEFRHLPRHVPVCAARVTEQPALAGAGQHALRELRATIHAVARSRSNPG